MILALASDGNKLAGHFGHCEGFRLYRIEEGKVLSEEFIENPGHKKGFLPGFLEEKAVNVIVSGGMGKGAVDLFEEKNIEVITGARGEVGELVEAYIRGELLSTGSICQEHEHRGTCGGH